MTTTVLFPGDRPVAPCCMFKIRGMVLSSEKGTHKGSPYSFFMLNVLQLFSIEIVLENAICNSWERRPSGRPFEHCKE
jgi:hypothetical protein